MHNSFESEITINGILATGKYMYTLKQICVYMVENIPIFNLSGDHPLLYNKSMIVQQLLQKKMA